MKPDFNQLGTAWWWHSRTQATVMSLLNEKEFCTVDNQKFLKDQLRTLRYNGWRIIAGFLGLSTNEAYNMWADAGMFADQDTDSKLLKRFS